MPVSPHLNGIKISSFRAIVEPLEIPLRQKITFLVGQNNSGKTSILRALGLLLNDGEPNAEDVSTFTNDKPNVEFLIDTQALLVFANIFQGLKSAIRFNLPQQFSIQKALKPGGALRWSSELNQIIEPDYFNGIGGAYSKDFSTSSSVDNDNKERLLGILFPYLKLPKTVLVPSQRMILQNGHSLPHFGQIEFPGSKIHINTIVDDLARLDRPSGTLAERDNSRGKLSSICEFIAHCLEVSQVEINVPDGKNTIYVKIDGNEQPISNLGSGIEQLIIIGMGSFMFPEQLVLIDEPEIHFHPRTQKRMIQFLHDKADAKFVIATHSAAIIDSVEADIVQIYLEQNKCKGNVVEGKNDRYDAIRNLGHSPSELVLANFVIWVEGPSDRVYINHFIAKLDPLLIEGVDYTIIFYGGSVLARHEFEDSDRDFVKALSISRNFAVYMDSDKESETAELKTRVRRVSSEVIKNGGIAWVSICREIENYIPNEVLSALTSYDCSENTQYGQIVKADKFDKVAFAQKATEIWGDVWPLDLKERCKELVKAIQQAR